MNNVLSDEAAFREGVRDLIAHVALRASGLPKETMAAFVFEGPDDVIGEHGLTYAELGSATHIVPDLQRIVNAVEAERIALLSFTDDIELAQSVSGVVVSAIGLPALRVVVGSENWVVLNSSHISEPVEKIAESRVAAQAVAHGQSFVLERQ